MERGKISIEHSSDKNIRVIIELANGTVWLTKHEIARLLDVFVQAVSANLREIFKDKELFEHEVTRQHKYTDKKGNICHTEFYNLDVIIALAFRMKGGFCRPFREWLREQAKRPIVESCRQPIIIQVGKSTFLN